MKPIIFSLLWIAATASQLHASPLVMESNLEQAVMIELYTSEGCSSCPPAERYLNSFSEHRELWSTYIPLAFHVDYWNDLGWKDRFSSREFSQRQRQYAALKRKRTVYTPAFIVNGDNWRPNHYGTDIDVPRETVGRLKLVVDREQGIQAEFQMLDDDTGPKLLNIALLGMGIETHIRAGENRGKQAHHKFVVLSHQQFSSTSRRWQVALPKTAEQQARSFALAAWISRPGDPTPLQAVGGAIPGDWVTQ